MAAVAAATAAAEQPKLATPITKAAVAAAPKRVGKIVAAVCRVAPHDYRGIAIAAADAAPGSGKEILDAVTSVLPGLTPYIDSAIASYHGSILSVAEILSAARSPEQSGSDQAAAAPGSSGAFPRGPAVGPPYVPFSGTPGNITPGTGGQVPTGGRNYAAP